MEPLISLQGTQYANRINDSDLKAWIILLLNRHKLQNPDGRPLYRYRITDSEFENLKRLIKTASDTGIKNISGMQSWRRCFVVYASEWWRRDYSGQWGWSAVFSSVNYDVKELTIEERNDLIEIGLILWRRKIRKGNGDRRQFLGTIATEGGLPLHQLSESGGWLEKFLNPVVKKHLSKGISISDLIASYEDFIPRNYRSDEIKNILSDIAETVTELRQEHKLELKEKPIRWLDSHILNWREKFPLPLDNVAARTLLVELVNTASKKTNEKSQNPFEIERYLAHVDTQSPEIIVEMELSSFVTLESIGLNNSEDHIPANFVVEVIDSDGSVWVWCRGLLTCYKGEQCIKLSGEKFKLSGDHAIKELFIRFHAMGDVFFEQSLINGFALERDLPWLFRSKDSKWLLHGVATQTVKDKKALVYIPSTYSYQCLTDSSALSKKGELYDGNIYSLSGSVQCLDIDRKFNLSTGIKDSVIQYRLTGERYSHYSAPAEIYIGKPELVEYNQVTNYSSTANKNRLVAKLVGVDTGCLPLTQVEEGYYEIRLYDSDNSILFQKRVGILDKAFGYSIKPVSASVGSIILKGGYNCRVNTESGYKSHQNVTNENTTEIQFQTTESPPLYVNVFLNPQQQRRELELRFPYPSRGALLFDPEGNQIPISTPLYMADLLGYRIKIFADKFSSTHRTTLDFSLVDSDIGGISLKDIYIRTSVRIINQATEFVINDWVQPIETLFGVSSSPDSKIKISLLLHGKEQFCIHVYQFRNKLIPDYENGTVGFSSAAFKRVASEKLETIKIHAFYLNQPEQSDFVLLTHMSEGVPTGKWLFQPEKRDTGPWIIYPPVNATFNFRPILWNVGESYSDDITANTLPKAAVIGNRESREIVYHRVLQQMLYEYDHKSWDYLDSLWKKTHHLPTPTFDIWKIAISESGFMASLLMHNHDDLIEKLESELPLIWELVSLKDWKDALLIWQKKLSKDLDDDKELIVELLQQKIEKIESLSLSMLGIGKILRLELLGQDSPELQGIDQFIRPQISRELQSLLRRKADKDWPTLLNRQIVEYHQNVENAYSSLLIPPHQFQQSIVFLPAVLAWDMLSGDSFLESSHPAAEIFKIKQLKSFDEDWFNNIFQYLSVWLYQHFKQKEVTHV